MLRNVVEFNKYRERNTNLVKHEEYQYLNLLNDLLNNGKLEEGRNGNTLREVGSVMHFSLKDGSIPILTTKKTAWKTCLKELLWFIKGDTSNKRLNEKGVHIWDGNTTPEFMRSRDLSHYEDGDLGPLYGFQWKHFNAHYEGCNSDYNGKGVNQLQNVINDLINPHTRSSRRHIVSAWNPQQLDEGVLPPCHVLFQFVVTDGNKLSCTLYQRSNDEFLGVPFNIASYSFLTHLIAKHCGLEAHEFIHYGGDVHIYDDHLEQVKEQITREPYEFPTLEILNKRDNIEDYVLEDFKINNYQCHGQLKGNMRA
jgi:thymidylate synthase